MASKLGDKLQKQMIEACKNFSDIPRPNTEGLSFGIKDEPVFTPWENQVGLQDDNIARVHGSTPADKAHLKESYEVLGFDKKFGLPTLKPIPNSPNKDHLDGYTRSDALYEIDGVKGTAHWEADTSNISDYERSIFAGRMNPKPVPQKPLVMKDVLAMAKKLIRDNELGETETAVRKWVELLTQPATKGGVNLRKPSWITNCVNAIMRENGLGQYKRSTIYSSLGQANKKIKSKNIKNPRGKTPNLIGSGKAKHLKPRGNIVEVKMTGNDHLYVRDMDGLATKRSGQRRDKYREGCVTEVYMDVDLQSGRDLDVTREMAMDKIRLFVEREKVEKGTIKFCWKIIGFLPQGENETDLIPVNYDPSK
tara:strand:- start:529 stop:1623 length:1095 start_codon:yes stop_codon:yes gene_type:complete